MSSAQPLYHVTRQSWFDRREVLNYQIRPANNNHRDGYEAQDRDHWKPSPRGTTESPLLGGQSSSKAFDFQSGKTVFKSSNFAKQLQMTCFSVCAFAIKHTSTIFAREMPYTFETSSKLLRASCLRTLHDLAEPHGPGSRIAFEWLPS